jgi:tRNA (guanine10-N2)-dimethyltransferase
LEVLYFLISGAHKTLPVEEVEALHEAEGCPYKLLSVHSGLVLAEGDPNCSKRIAERSAFVKEVGVVYRIGDERGYVELKEGKFSKLSVRRVEGSAVKVPPPEGSGVPGRAVVTEGFYVIGVKLSERKLKRTKKGPFFSPGSMDPLLARAMVNLSRVKKGAKLLDPFCGTGVFAVEASNVGATALCSDLDPSMCYGARINVEHLNAFAETLRADAAEMPFRSASIDAIATDPPYGRSVLSLGHGVEELLESFLVEAKRVLKSNSWITFATSSEVDAEDVVKRAGLRLNKCHVMRVHKSLARLICTALKI